MGILICWRDRNSPVEILESIKDQDICRKLYSSVSMLPDDDPRDLYYIIKHSNLMLDALIVQPFPWNRTFQIKFQLLEHYSQ